MSGRSVVISVLVVIVGVSCGVGGEGGDSNKQPEVTVLGTTVDPGAPQPTLGSAVSTERD